jgi:intron-binding protein aquarius
MVLEFSQYLENYLWPNYKLGASYAHMLSIVNMVNEKFRERVQVWQVGCSVAPVGGSTDC